jgi:formylglycine-generating enzyme required for sulfatase activity
VRQYETKGDSPFGVVDMVGNVWEWCLTDYETNTDDINRAVKNRDIRGGSWWVKDIDGFRVDNPSGYDPSNRVTFIGFRIALY